jgi:hypothetical protein
VFVVNSGIESAFPVNNLQGHTASVTVLRLINRDYLASGSKDNTVVFIILEDRQNSAAEFRFYVNSHKLTVFFYEN